MPPLKSQQLSGHRHVSNNNFFASRNQLWFSFGRVFRRAEWPSSSIVSKNVRVIPAERPKFRIQDAFVGERLRRQGELSTHPLCANLPLVVALYVEGSGHGSITASHMGETGTNGTEYGCGDRAAHDLLGKLVRSPRLVGVNANYDERPNFQPEAGFFEVIS